MRTGIIFLVCCWALAVQGAAPERPRLGEDELIHGGNVQANKVAVDTLVLMGPWSSGAAYNGQFQTPDGQPAWNGWTSHDYTVPIWPNHWHRSDYNAANLNGHGEGNLAAWCGDPDIPACTPEDPAGGYGNRWDEALRWSGTVPDPEQPCLVQLEAWLNLDTEPAYDFFYVSLEKPDGSLLDLWTRDGILENEHLEMQFLCEPLYFTGPDADQINLRLRFTSDGGWSDGDCMYPTQGAVQIDDITVSLDGGQVSTFDDFETDLGHWQPVEAVGVGDFAKIWSHLQEVDPCNTNYSPQLAFIDDGQVVPGTGGTNCIDWCYGPGGYIVNNSGGLAGEGHYLDSMVHSPVIPWPGEQYQGCTLEFDVYRHEMLAADSPGISDLWMFRCTSSPDPADIELAWWKDRDSGIRTGGPYYLRQVLGVSDFLEPGTRFIQMKLGAWQFGHWWDWVGENGTPAPYLDNVRILAYEFYGPGMSIWKYRLARDGFPESGILDLANLAGNSVRFDSRVDKSLNDDPRIDPGDSLFCNISSVRAGAELVGTPRLYYKLQANPVFDPYRSSGLPQEGWVEGWRPLDYDGEPNRNGFAFDLPDTGFFFPGDVIHYFFAATDAIDGALVQTNLVPADTTGFGDFSGLGSYDPAFIVRALPSLRHADDEPEAFTVPGILFWNRFATRSSLSQWRQALVGLGLEHGVDFDIYGSLSEDDALASEATAELLAGYSTLLFSSGNLYDTILGTVDNYYFKADDVGLLNQWFQQGGKNALLTGNHLAYNLHQWYSSQPFLADWLGLECFDDELRPLIGNQMAPLILAEAGNPVISSVDSWHMLAYCPYTFRSTDAVAPLPGAVRLAEFADPAGSGGSYSYAAATLNEVPDYQARVISLPYDLMYIQDAAGGREAASLPARTRLLGDCMSYFGVPFDSNPISDVPGAGQLAARHYPNPFNPRLCIDFSLPRDSRVTLKVFNVRGELVATVLDESLPAGPHQITWNGTDSSGAAASSGLYFYELRAAGQTRLGKMTLLR